MNVKATFLDVDTLPRSKLDNISVEFRTCPSTFEYAPEKIYRRWRSALFAGNGFGIFLAPFFCSPASAPWSGFITLPHSKAFGYGLCLTQGCLLLGKSLMLVPSAFPYVEWREFVTRQGAVGFELTMPEQNTYLPGVVCNVSSAGLRIYGHWIVDLMPRLYKVLKSGISVDYYIISSPEMAWQKQILEALEVSFDKVIFWDPKEKVIISDQMIIPTFDRFNSEVRAELMDVHKFLREKYASAELQAPPTKKLYVSRTQWGGSRNLANRSQIDDIFKDCGFEVVMPEKLSFIEQIRLFAQASVVVGECGSGMHNCVYCRAGTRVGLLQSNTNHNFLQAQIGMFASHDIFYLIGEQSEEVDGWKIDKFEARRFAKLINS